MKTITIESEFEKLLIVYQVWAYTNKGDIPYCSASTKRSIMSELSDFCNKNVPYYDDVHKTIIHQTYVRDIIINID